MKADEQHFSQLKQIYDKHPKAYHMMLRNREHAGLRSWIGQQTPMLADGIYALSTKCYWILHGMHDFPVC